MKKIKLVDKNLAKHMIIHYHFTKKNLKMGFKIIPESHNIHHLNPLLNITPNFLEFGTAFRYIIKIIKKCLFFMMDYLISINLKIKLYFRRAFRKLTKTMKEIMTLNYS